MKYQAILTKSTTDQIKSKIMNTEYCQIVLDVYIKPEDYARFITRFFNDAFEIDLPEGGEE